MNNKRVNAAIWLNGVYLASYVLLALSNYMIFGRFTPTSFASNIFGIAASVYMLVLSLSKRQQKYRLLGTVPLLLGLSKIIMLLPAVIGIGLQNAGVDYYRLWGLSVAQGAAYIVVSFMYFFELLSPVFVSFLYGVPILINLFNNSKSFIPFRSMGAAIPRLVPFYAASELYHINGAFLIAAAILLTLSGGFSFKSERLKALQSVSAVRSKAGQLSHTVMYSLLLGMNLLSLILFAAFTALVIIKTSFDPVFLCVSFLILLSGEGYIFIKSVKLLKKAYTAYDISHFTFITLVHHFLLGAAFTVSFGDWGEGLFEMLVPLAVYGISVIPAIALGAYIFANLVSRFEKLVVRKLTVAGAMLLNIGIAVCILVSDLSAYLSMDDYDYLTGKNSSEGKIALLIIFVYLIRGAAFSTLIWYSNPNNTPQKKI